MTGAELVSGCIGHIGNRSDGVIGSETVQVSCMNSLNKGLMYAAKKYNPYDLEKNVTLNITSANYSYELPVVDDDAETIRIKSCEVARLKQGSETTGRILEVVPVQVFDRRYVILDSSRTGRPCTMAGWNTTIKLYPWPDAEYSLYIRANVWPTLFTVATLVNNSALSEEWDAPVIAYAVADLFAKLQQPEDSNTWLTILNGELKATRSALSQYKNQHLSGSLRDTIRQGTNISGYGQDPFVMRNL